MFAYSLVSDLHKFTLPLYSFFLKAEGNRNSSAGLGAKGAAAVKANPNESYKDSVKRTLFSRYHDIE